MKRILFVCKGNRFRSQTACAFFNKLNKNKKYKAASAGVIKGRPISKAVRGFASKNKLKLTKPKTIEEDFLQKQDIIVIVADNVHPITFAAEKKAGKILKVWRIKDVCERCGADAESIGLAIKKKVESFLRQLK